jgi:hypothetical protein
VLALNTSCAYCNASVPFYREMRAAQRRHASEFEMVAVFPNHSDSVSRFLKQSQLDVAGYGDVDLHKLNVFATPTVLLVNRDGRIIDFWQGTVSPEAEGSVLRRIFGEDDRAGPSEIGRP